MSRFVPRGVAVAGLGRRFLAFLIDVLPVLVIAGVSAWIFWSTESASLQLVTGIVAGVLVGVYLIAQWWAYGTRGVGLGAAVAKIRIVGIDDGEPVGWWRFFLRELVFVGLMITVVGGIAMVVFLIIQERRQGWHDMAAKSLVVEPVAVESQSRERHTRVTATSTVGLPPHLASGFAPKAGTTQQATPQEWAAYAPKSEPGRPAWLPQLEAEPVDQPFTRPPGQGAGFPGGQPPQPRTAAQDPAPQTARFGRPDDGVSSAGQPTARRHAQSPVETPRVRERSFQSHDDSDDTRITPVASQRARPQNGGWYIRLDDGREITLDVAVLLGRNPHKTQGDPEVQLVAAGGDGRMISRTHVMVGVDPRGPYVMDRGSTNGTAVVTPEGKLEPCPVGAQVRVREGQQVSYGDRWFTVLR